MSGDKEWTQVEAVIQTGEQAYVLPKMVLYGQGEAWFDDMSLNRGEVSEARTRRIIIRIKNVV